MTTGDIAAARTVTADWDCLKTLNFGLFLVLPVISLFARAVADMIVVLIALSFLAVCWRSRSWTWTGEAPFALAIVIWVFLNIVVSPFAEDSSASFGRSLSWIRFPLFYAAVTVWLVVDARALRIVAGWMAVLVLLITADVLVQAVIGTSLSGQPIIGGRLTGPLERPDVGTLLAKFGFPTFALLGLAAMSSTNRLLIVAGSLFCGLTFVAILLTGDRSATALTLLSAILLIALIFVSRPGWRFWALGVSIALIGLVVTVLTLDDRIQARATLFAETLLQFGQSVYFELFAVAVHMFAENPLTGVGLRNFRIGCPAYEVSSVISECHPHPHNIYLEWLSETGTFGFLLFIGLVISIIWKVLAQVRFEPDDIVPTGFLLGALVINFFPVSVTQSFFSNWPAILLWFSLAYATAVARWMRVGFQS